MSGVTHVPFLTIMHPMDSGCSDVVVGVVAGSTKWQSTTVTATTTTINYCTAIHWLHSIVRRGAGVMPDVTQLHNVCVCL